MTTDQIAAYVMIAWPVLGAVGTAVEAVGTKLGKPTLVAIGARLEALFVDGPKLLKGKQP